MKLNKAPWTQEQVELLKLRQVNGFHEYTCVCSKTLIPTLLGWVCSCGYTQNWCHDADLKTKKKI